MQSKWLLACLLVAFMGSTIAEPAVTMQCIYVLLNDGRACLFENILLVDFYQPINIISEGLELRESEVHSVVIRDSTLLYIPNEIFLHFRYLYELSITENVVGLTELQPYSMQGADNLFFLVICNTNISVLTSRAFGQSPLLRTLSLNNNQISTIAVDAFYGLQSLTSLWLVGNKLTELKQKIFTDTVSLEKIYLWNNQILEISPGIFEELKKLRLLDLEFNKCVSMRYLKGGDERRREIFKTIYAYCHWHDL